MCRDSTIPEHVTRLLADRKLAILGPVEKTGSGHWSVKFPAPNGGVAKWQWPRREGKSDPRAMLNNRSQFKHYLRRLYG